MNFFRTNAILTERDRLDQQEAEVRSTLSTRQKNRLERDQERGYSINVKQIVLAFAVEFVIIGLILTNNFVTVAQLPDATNLKTIHALLFPIAMAMVELARVPLAVAVRTQNSWHVKLAALVGVLCAVAVTSTSLIQIGNSTFNPRLEETHIADTKLAELKSRREALSSQITQADSIVKQRQSERDRLFQATQALMVQLNAQKPQECTTTTIPSPTPGGAPETRQRCQPNPALKPLNAAIAESKTKLNEAEAAVKEAETLRQDPKYDTTKLDAEIRAAERESRGSIYQSQLHAYAAMLLAKDPKDVNDGDVKLLEWYLIVIPSIAAAFSSTLIAMTSVRRIKPKKSLTEISFPDEAAAYLFGPLVTAIRKEARDAVVAATQGQSKENSA
ncbi:hypothetical protein ACVIIV_001894 [Bradyrhizobium sp. USDA 4354]